MPRSKVMPAVLVAFVTAVTVTHWNSENAPAQLGLGVGGRTPGLSGFQSSSLIVVPMKDDHASTWLAFSIHSGTWARHTFPCASMVQPRMGAQVCSFSIKGKQVQELVAVDRNGNWRTHSLVQPTDSPCIATVSASIACYSIDGRTYAFSAVTGTWDSIPAQGPAAVSANFATVQDETTIAAFSAETGRWSVASLAAREQP